MGLSTYALISTDELKEHMGMALEQASQDPVLENIINRASEAIETFLCRRIVKRSGDITEYHTMPPRADTLLALQFPILTVTSVKEGAWSAGAWTASATLTSSNYVYEATSGRFFRLEANWYAGRDGVQLVYTAGYATTALVPGPLKDVCLAVAARKYSQIRRGGDFSAQTISDAMGSVTRFLPADLTTMDKQQLYPWRAHNYSPTGRTA